MILDSLRITPDAFEAGTGWKLKPEGACHGEVCVPLDPATVLDGQVDITVAAERLGMPLVREDGMDLWALGPVAGGRALVSAEAPDITLPGLDGKLFSLSSLRGKKVVVVTWASWCGCRFYLSGWQELRTELAALGVEIVTVAMETGGTEAARPWIEAAQPTHPSLIDQYHVLGELLGVVNVPNSVWIDEDGTIVRPVEVAYIRTGNEASFTGFLEAELPEGLPPRLLEMLDEATRVVDQADTVAYTAALRDWAANGTNSRYALSPEEVVARSAPRNAEVARAAACFELGAHLWCAGQEEAGARWWREAHRLQPDNWTYKRQAWQFASPMQGPSDLFESDWLSEVRSVGAENYYPALEL